MYIHICERRRRKEERKEGDECFFACSYQIEQAGTRMFYFELRWQRCLVSVCLTYVCVCVCVSVSELYLLCLRFAFVFTCAIGAICHRMKFHARLHGNSDSVCHALMHRRSAPTFSFPH